MGLFAPTARGPARIGGTGVGTHGDSIDTADVDGIALAAIQGINRQVEARDARIADLEQQIVDLRELVLQLMQSEAP